jgi:threonine/homoserine/homoserine lactone efflux protein
MSLELYSTYLVACLVIVIVPGPTATLIVANSLRHGTRAGLLNVAGTQIGLAIIVVLVGVGVASAIDALGHWFEWLRLVGAAYLVWLGWRLICDRGGTVSKAPPQPPRMGFLVQGCVVALSNPKTLLFFGAFFPQFIDPAHGYAGQIALMGATAMLFAAVADGVFAIAAGRTARAVSPRCARWLSRCGGGFLIGGGIWLALSRDR